MFCSQLISSQQAAWLGLVQSRKEQEKRHLCHVRKQLRITDVHGRQGKKWKFRDLCFCLREEEKVRAVAGDSLVLKLMIHAGGVGYRMDEAGGIDRRGKGRCVCLGAFV